MTTSSEDSPAAAHPVQGARRKARGNITQLTEGLSQFGSVCP